MAIQQVNGGAKMKAGGNTACMTGKTDIIPAGESGEDLKSKRVHRTPGGMAHWLFRGLVIKDLMKSLF